ncbi:hypothetical protein TWF703_009635 [Orbilia oligospora]|nr:hypothetical protein TWF703_009635 [Orbilia oligospora]
MLTRRLRPSIVRWAEQLAPLISHNQTQTQTQTRIQTQRLYSSSTPQDDGPHKPKGTPDIDPSALTIERTTTPKPLLDHKDLIFGRNFTDHMLSIEWTAQDGWLPPRITPYQNLSLDPSACVFHYAFTCFEGMKAYKDSQNRVRLFRPDRNMHRLNRSSSRIALPTFDGDKFTELISKFVELEERFIPKQKGYSLYLRPTMIGTQNTLGIGPPGSALLYVIASPVGPYYPTGFKAITLEATESAVRAWPGGVGDRKLGANYAPCIVPQVNAAKRGYSQNLWLFGEEGYVTEVGTMNMFVAWVNEDGVKELITAPLDGTILEGVTRESILALAREKLAPEGWKVSEEKYTMAQVKKAAHEGRLLEAFGAGTAAVVAPVKAITWRGEEVKIPLSPGKETGPLTESLWNWMLAIQYGDVEHPWSQIISK